MNAPTLSPDIEVWADREEELELLFAELNETDEPQVCEELVTEGAR